MPRKTFVEQLRDVAPRQRRTTAFAQWVLLMAWVLNAELAAVLARAAVPDAAGNPAQIAQDGIFGPQVAGGRHPLDAGISAGGESETCRALVDNRRPYRKTLQGQSGLAGSSTLTLPLQ